MSNLTSQVDIQEFLKDSCVPKALRALEAILDSEDPKAADIKLAISLAREFGVTWEAKQPKPLEGLKLLAGFSREEQAKAASGDL